MLFQKEKDRFFPKMQRSLCIFIIAHAMMHATCFLYSATKSSEIPHRLPAVICGTMINILSGYSILPAWSRIVLPLERGSSMQNLHSHWHASAAASLCLRIVNTMKRKIIAFPPRCSDHFSFNW